MKIYFASDHAGFELKNKLVSYVRDELGHEVEDYGAHVYDPDDDYPDFVARAARQVSRDPANARAIVLGGSGQGEAIVANKFRGVRAAVFYSFVNTLEHKSEGDKYDVARLSREHNDANVLSLGARFLTEYEARAAVKMWLQTKFRGEEKHARRLDKIVELESRNFGGIILDS